MDTSRRPPVPDRERSPALRRFGKRIIPLLLLVALWYGCWQWTLNRERERFLRGFGSPHIAASVHILAEHHGAFAIIGYTKNVYVVDAPLSALQVWMKRRKIERIPEEQAIQTGQAITVVTRGSQLTSPFNLNSNKIIAFQSAKYSGASTVLYDLNSSKAIVYEIIWGGP